MVGLGVGGGARERFLYSEGLGNSSYPLHSFPLLTPFIKPISILKAVGNPSVQSAVSYLTQSSSTLPGSPLTDNPAQGASPASGDTMGHPVLKGVPWSPTVGPSCVLGDSSVAAHNLLSSPIQGIRRSLWPLCFKLFWLLKQWGLVLKAACSCGPGLRPGEGQVGLGVTWIAGIPPDLGHPGRRGVLVGRAP